MDTREKLKYPASGRLCGGGSELGGKRLLALFKCLADAVLQRTVDQKTESHDHHQCHDALWRLEKQGIRHEPGILQKAKAPFDFLLPRRIVIKQLFVAEL